MAPSQYCPLAALLVAAWALTSADVAVGATPATPSDSSPQTAAGSTQNDAASSDDAVKSRVENALLSSKYSLETHVTVTVSKGEVRLGGFVWDDWDRRHALKIAAQNAGGKRVIDEIDVKRDEDR
jgi:osmotically-inducible protein OsmY